MRLVLANSRLVLVHIDDPTLLVHSEGVGAARVVDEDKLIGNDQLIGFSIRNGDGREHSSGLEVDDLHRTLCGLQDVET